MNYPLADFHYVVFRRAHINNGSCRERFKPLLIDKNFCEYCTDCIRQSEVSLTFRHRASSIEDRRFVTLQRTLLTYLINKYISLSDICLTVHN